MVLMQHFNDYCVLVAAAGILESKNRTDTVSKPVSYGWKYLVTDLIIS